MAGRRPILLLLFVSLLLVPSHSHAWQSPQSTTREPEGGLEHLQAELDLAVRSSNLRMEASIRLSLGRKAYQSGHYDEAARHLQSSRDLAETLGDRLLEGVVLSVLARNLRAAGKV